MTIPDRYDAFWIPGPETFDMDEGLRLGYQWLDGGPVRNERVVLLNAKTMLNNRPMLAQASQYHVVSPRSRHIPHTTAGRVLAIWPSPETLELAQQLALDSALCVIPYRQSIDWWIARSGAVNLTDPEAEPAKLAQPEPAVAEMLDSILGFGGHNSFVGAYEKEESVQGLRTMVARGHRPDPQDLEEYARASGKTDIEGARRLSDLYDKVLAGKRLRNHRGRAI